VSKLRQNPDKISDVYRRNLGRLQRSPNALISKFRLGLAIPPYTVAVLYSTAPVPLWVKRTTRIVLVPMNR